MGFEKRARPQRVIAYDLDHGEPLDDPEEEAPLGLFIPDEVHPGPEEEAIARVEREHLEDELDNLPILEEVALATHYGLMGEHPRTWKEVGEDLCVTPRQARYLGERGMLRLRFLL